MRRTSLTRSSYLQRKTRIKPRNARRLKRLRAANFGDQADRCRESVCVVCLVTNQRQTTPTEAAHVKSRGAGGDSSQCLPLCSLHHREQHSIGVASFFSRYRVDPERWLMRMREGAVITEMEFVPA